jgi:hypothetical protein
MQYQFFVKSTTADRKVWEPLLTALIRYKWSTMLNTSLRFLWNRCNLIFYMEHSPVFLFLHFLHYSIDK